MPINGYYTFLSTSYYLFLFSYLQLWWSYAILSATTIICSKCPPSAEMHAGWSHLIWHNFVTVGVNWIKICSLGIGTGNRRIKCRLKIACEKCQKMPAAACISSDGEHFEHVVWTWWLRLPWHNFVKVAGNWIKICSQA